MTKRKTISCLHYEVIVGSIGTCVYCGQVKDYDPAFKKPRILKRGSIDGITTKVTLPDIPVDKEKETWARPSLSDRIGVKRVRNF